MLCFWAQYFFLLFIFILGNKNNRNASVSAIMVRSNSIISYKQNLSGPQLSKRLHIVFAYRFFIYWNKHAAQTPRKNTTNTKLFQISRLNLQFLSCREI